MSEWQTVPIEPDEGMLVSMCEVIFGKPFDDDCIEPMRKAYKAALSAAPQPTDDQGWQPVENPPKERGMYLTVDPCTDMYHFVGWDNEEGWGYMYVSFWDIDNMTHWMPVPKPPEAE